MLSSWEDPQRQPRPHRAQDEKVAGIKTWRSSSIALEPCRHAKKVFLGLTNQIPNRLNANLGELIGPALGNPKVVKEVQLASSLERCALFEKMLPLPYSSPTQSSCFGSFSSMSLRLCGAQSGNTFALSEVGPSILVP